MQAQKKKCKKTKNILSLYSNTLGIKLHIQSPLISTGSLLLLSCHSLLLCLISHTFSSFRYIRLPLLLLFPFTNCLLSVNTEFLCYKCSWWSFKTITDAGTSLYLLQYSLWSLTHFYNVDKEILSLNCTPNLFFNINYSYLQKLSYFPLQIPFLLEQISYSFPLLSMISATKFYHDKIS